ncbi:MAG: hydrogenase maturation protease [Spirochaetales bacterium]|nr:hydrogenase maturation protease [Spirochaetales bacterium]
MKKNVLIIGIGNVLLKDEGIGIHSIRRIQADAGKKQSPWQGAEFLAGGTSGLDMLEQLKGRDKIIIVDAAQTNDPPGTIYRLNENDLKTFTPGEKLSLHNINLRDVVNLLSFLQETIPEIVIIAINAKDISPGECLTEEIENKMPEVLALIHKEYTALATPTTQIEKSR